jgi:hypothetical protein
MFCPNCKAEYRAGFTRCSDCDVPLVSALPLDSPPTTDETDSVEVFSAADRFEAETVKGLLEANGIEVFLADGSTIPGLPGAVSLFVSGSQADLAEDLIEEMKADGDTQ